MSRRAKHTIYMREYRRRVKSAPRFYQPIVSAAVYPELARKVWR